jgi:hypothetical protein
MVEYPPSKQKALCLNPSAINKKKKRHKLPISRVREVTSLQADSTDIKRIKEHFVINSTNQKKWTNSLKDINYQPKDK